MRVIYSDIIMYIKNTLKVNTKKIIKNKNRF